MEEKGKERYVPNRLMFKSKSDEKTRIPPASYSNDEEWVQEYVMQFGEEPSFF